MPTIQAALGAAGAGDTILLTDGTFLGSGNRDLDYLGKAVTVRSASGDPTSCVIDCEGSQTNQHRGFYFHRGEGAGSVLEGVTITRGWIGFSPEGGSGACFLNASPRIAHCRFVSNHAEYVDGGGLYIVGTSPLLEDCVFLDNSATYACGGGIRAGNAALTLTNCTFYYNEATMDGGAIWCGGALSLTTGVFQGNTAWCGGAFRQYGNNPPLDLTNCVFQNNVAYGEYGGAIFLSPGSLFTMTDCIFRDNTAQKGGAIYGQDGATGTFTRCVLSGNAASDRGGAIGCGQYITNWALISCTLYRNYSPTGGSIRCTYDSHVNLNRCIVASGLGGAAAACDETSSVTAGCSDVFGNAGGDWVGPLEGQEGINGNFSLDPCFCDAENGDYHLWNYSPCAQEGCGLIGAWPVGCEDPMAVEREPLPRGLSLSVWPNPVGGAAQIRYVLPTADGQASLGVYDLAGRLIRAFESDASGSLAWDGADALGHRVAAGPYFFRMRVGENELTKRVMLIR
ncbi:MAG: right-handed parallel beta-helix repeat-containing protein [Candidatus Eisenbacteria bacterium]|nr:right-handed parallel beta-helix repeat-containing protein [Candidatus Eisenbacteria bacterium]